MKKLISAILALTMMMALVACGSNNTANNNSNTNNDDIILDGGADIGVDANEGENDVEPLEAPDLQKFVEDYLNTLAEDDRPMLMPVEGEMLDGYYAGLTAIATKQCVVQMPAISAVACEFALIECENAEDIEAVKAILQARIDYQVDGGAWYPETVAAWEGAQIVVNGNVVALIVFGDKTADTVTAFNALFA